MLKSCLTFAFLLCLTNDSVHGEAGLRLEIHAVQDTFVVHEPVRLTCTFKNESDSTLRIMDVQQYGSNMKHMYYVVQTPGGELESRRVLYMIGTGFYMSDYVGEPLAPGDEVEFFMYPAYTRKFDPETGETYGGGNTLPAPGWYRLQLAHFVPRQLPKLWAGNSTARTVMSDPIEITIVEGTDVDEKILGALWENDGGGWLSEGDDHRSQREDEQLLRDIVKRFPRERMSKYVYLGLARSLSTPSTFNREVELGRTREAVGYLELLAAQYPDFRREEVAEFLGFGYAYLGNPDKARRVFDDAIRANPRLSTHYEFMSTRLASLYPHQPAVREWSYARQRGELFVEPARVDSGK
jgi:hypothetical protein